MKKFISRVRPISLLIVLIVINLTFFAACRKDSTRKVLPKVVNGVLDLSNWDLKKDGPVDLTGEWEFYWDKHLTPKDFSKSNPPERTSLMSIPGGWNGYLLEGNQLSGDGYATYRLKILMNDQKGNFAFKLQDIHTAFIIYVNGEKISSAGVTGKTYKATTPYVFPEVSDFISETNQVEIILQVSNFHHRLGGPLEVIQLGREKGIRKIRERSLVLYIFLCGSILFIGLYHLILFFIRKKDRSLLYFGILCVLIVFRFLAAGERYFIHFFPSIGWELIVKIEYLSFYLAIPIFAMFLYSLFYREVSKRVLRTIQFLGILFSCIVLLTPAKIYSHTVQPYQVITLVSCIYGIYVLILSLVRKREGSFLLFLGSFMLVLAVANDILLYNRIITQIGPLVPLGVFIFIFIQAFLLSRRFSMAFNTVEKQTQELTKTNKAYRQEINEHLQAREALQESEERFKLIFDYAPDGYYLIDFEGRFLDGNIMAEKISGYSKEELIGKGFHETDLLSSDELTKAIDVLIKCTQGLTSGPAELTLKKKDGDTVEIEITVYPIKIKNKNIILGIARDVTEKKNLEGQLAQAQKMESIGTLAGGIAHDFNNLLMAIEGNATLMMLEVDPKHAHYKRLKNIEKFIQDGSGLTKQLLGFARGGKYEVKPTVINDLIRKCCDMFGRTKKEIRMNENYQEDVWPIESDHGQLEQVFLNLFVNAWQAMPNGGELYISTENIVLKDDSSKPHDAKPGKYIKISIADTGIGIDQSILQKIFDPFFTTKEMGRGTGLGLASSYGIIKNHGGFINVYSEKSEGTTFNVYLPASEKEVAEDTGPHDIILEGSETVLFIDDEEIIIDGGKQLLERLGYSVLTATNGEKAIRLYEEKKGQIDLVLLDMIMPGMGGGEIFNKLKESNPDIKVLLSSGYSINGQAQEIMDRGCDGFIQKPFNLQHLSHKLREILDKK